MQSAFGVDHGLISKSRATALAQGLGSKNPILNNLAAAKKAGREAGRAQKIGTPNHGAAPGFTSAGLRGKANKTAAKFLMARN